MFPLYIVLNRTGSEEEEKKKHDSGTEKWDKERTKEDEKKTRMKTGNQVMLNSKKIKRLSGRSVETHEDRW